MTEFAGLDPAQMEASAHELSVALDRVGDALASVSAAEALAEVADLTGDAHRAVSELREEILLTIALLRSRAASMRLVDRWAPADMVWLGRSMQGRLPLDYGAPLSASLSDPVGGDGAGAEVRILLERRTWQLAGHPHSPPSTMGPFTGDHVDAFYADLKESLRDGERSRLEAALYQQFGSADVDGDMTRLGVATTLATLLIDARLGRASGRYWTTLSEDERSQLATDAPELLAHALARTGVLTDGELDTLDAENAYDVFGHELAAMFEVAVDVKFFTVELGGDIVAAFTKLSDGSVVIELGVGAHAGVGFGPGEAKTSIGFYLKEASTLILPDEASAAAAVRDLTAAIEEDADRSVGDVVRDWLGGDGLKTTEVIGDLWDGYGSEKSSEVGGYGEVESELRKLGAIDAEFEAKVEIGAYTTEDGQGNEVEDGVVFRLKASGEGEGEPIGAGGVAASALVKAYATRDGPSVIEIELVGEAAAGTTGTVARPPLPSGAAKMIEKLGVKLDGTSTRGVRSTVTIKLPLTKETMSAAKRALIDGDVDGLDDLEDMADIEVQGEEIVRSEIDAALGEGPVAVDASLEDTQFRTVELLRKRPYGEMYSAIEVDKAIDSGYELAG